MAVSISKTAAQQIVETVKDVCSHDINFINPYGRIIASTDEARIDTYHEIGQKVAASGKPIEVDSDEAFTGTHKGVNLPYIYHGEVIAVIGISGEPDQVRQYAYLAQKITGLILKEQEMETRRSSRRNEMNYVMRALLLKEPINREYLSDYLRSIQVHRDDYYRTIVIELDSRYHPANLSMIEDDIYQTFQTAVVPMQTFFYPNRFVVLMKAVQPVMFRNTGRDLARKYQGILKIGIGAICTLEEQHLSYNGALLAIKGMPPDQNYAIVDYMDLEVLLGDVSKEASEHYRNICLGSLSEKDKELLWIYFNHDMSLQKTGDELFMHKNTLQYRLRRIWEKCGYNPRDFRQAVLLYMALQLEQRAEEDNHQKLF